MAKVRLDVTQNLAIACMVAKNAMWQEMHLGKKCILAGNAFWQEMYFGKKYILARNAMLQMHWINHPFAQLNLDEEELIVMESCHSYIHDMLRYLILPT